MFTPIKVTHHEHDLWFVSDTHFHHAKPFILGPRGFATIEDHDNTLVQRWNQCLTERSVIFHLGDFVFGDPTGDRFKALCRRLSFARMYLLTGNHVSGHKAVYAQALFDQYGAASGQEVYPLIYHLDGGVKEIVFLPEYVPVEVNKHEMILCHYPIVSHHRINRGHIHLCGHSHGNLPLTNKDTGQGMRLDVGIESFGRPISLAEVKGHLKGRDNDTKDHHGRDD